LFIDGQIVGIPVNLAINGGDPAVGWIADTETNDNGVENEKMMRNRGYMKSGNAIYNSGYNITLRQAKNDLRVIVGTFTFQDYDYHYFRAKNVEREDGEFHLDYIEYVPVSYLDKENTD
ncbi:MAG TPA: fasciclin domain-containing protein, partial [Paludibacter sp.]|nr:fasciclin domain-containing protein [Paludibacter sp.]